MDFICTDGGMGTSLFDRNDIPSDICPELLNDVLPAVPQEIHEQFIEAGARLILTNTFGGNRRRLQMHGLEDRTQELNQAGARNARKAAVQQPDVIVAGSIGPTGGLFTPYGDITYTDAVRWFTEQAEALTEGGVDVLWIETMSCLQETEAAWQACRTVGLPTAVSMTFDTHGHTMMGVSPDRFAKWVNDRAEDIWTAGVNCGTGPGEAIEAARRFTAVSDSRVRVSVKSNMGIPEYNGGRLVYPVPVEQVKEYVEEAARAGGNVIGVCCGGTAAHVEAVSNAVKKLSDQTPENIQDSA